ncbi:hypothetical protein C882_2223 [Caenispirillum salinarum AK4]|uniref:Uncharacterized protein n=1 Tax=Caenispirillum salinarum AK4 TaxID=1238182 RepID=K9HCZ8_9PROT|nr:hypothetical protein [Caenispirillum salinarum]EKV26596.1 hypothetical protein C882_2223 [Caenispirillum salinarum AK4]
MADTSQKPTETDQVRAATDRGETGDKINQHDPATAPLETGAEAAGTPTPKAEAAKAAEDQKRTGQRAQQKQKHFAAHEQPQRKSPMSPGLWAGIIIGGLALLGIVLGLIG